MCCRDRSVGTATAIPPGQPRKLSSISGRGKRFFSSLERPGRLRGPRSLLSNGYRGVSPWLKRQGRDADHLLTSNAEVKIMELYLHPSIRPQGVVVF
jgi:hypothetical protein